MIRNKQGHFTVRSGKRVLVHMNDGRKLIAKFKEKRSRVITFFDHADIAINEVRTLTIHKGKI